MAKKNYDNDIRMELIRYLENPDSIGFDKKKRIWRPPTNSAKYDINQIGIGLDLARHRNPELYKLYHSRNPGYITEEEERDIRNKKFEEILKSRERRMSSIDNGDTTNRSYAMSVFLPQHIWVRGSANVANNEFEDSDIKENINKNDSLAIRKMQEYYPDRIRDQRTNKIDEFFKIHNISYNQKQWPNKIATESKNTKNENKTDTTKTKIPSKFSLILMVLKEIAKKSLK